METVTHTKNIHIGVIGAGSWGTALANLLAAKGFSIDLWVFEPEVRQQILDTRENAIFLPGIQLSENLRPYNDLLEVSRNKNMLLMVTPSHFVRDTASQMAGHLGPNTILVSASKGIENKTHMTMSAVLKDVLPGLSDNRLAILSGPSFAREVANHVPTAVTVASSDGVVADLVQHVLATPFFRVYAHDDIVGVELGGAVKNVIAIAAGVIDGLGLGLNTRAALITRGLAEIRRLGLTLGANPRTFTGLGGMGDLLLTCTGDLSRNHTVGKKLGKGKKLREILDGMTMVAEGVRTAKSVYNLSRKLGVEMPISHEVYSILYEDREPAKALQHLMTRDLKQELDAI